MNKWRVEYKKKAWEDFQELDASQKDQVAKAIRKVKTNPLPQREGGYGVELGNKAGLDLSGCLKIKLKKAGIRVVVHPEILLRSDIENQVITSNHQYYEKIIDYLLRSSCGFVHRGILRQEQ